MKFDKLCYYALNEGKSHKKEDEYGKTFTYYTFKPEALEQARSRSIDHTTPNYQRMAKYMITHGGGLELHSEKMADMITAMSDVFETVIDGRPVFNIDEAKEFMADFLNNDYMKIKGKPMSDKLADRITAKIFPYFTKGNNFTEKLTKEDENTYSMGDMGNRPFDVGSDNVGEMRESEKTAIVSDEDPIDELDPTAELGEIDDIGDIDDPVSHLVKLRHTGKEDKAEDADLSVVSPDERRNIDDYLRRRGGYDFDPDNPAY